MLGLCGMYFPLFYGTIRFHYTSGRCFEDLFFLFTFNDSRTVEHIYVKFDTGDL